MVSIQQNASVRASRQLDSVQDVLEGMEGKGRKSKPRRREDIFPGYEQALCFLSLY
jgi:hypothetical protein